MITIITRIPEELNEKLISRSKETGIPKSSIMKNALYVVLSNKEMQQDGN